MLTMNPIPCNRRGVMALIALVFVACADPRTAELEATVAALTEERDESIPGPTAALSEAITPTPHPTPTATLSPTATPTTEPSPTTASDPTPVFDEDALREDVTRIETEISEALREDARYSGGLVKTLIGARLEILRQTLTMLQQRSLASDHGIQLEYSVDGTPFTLPEGASDELENVRKELTDLDSEIRTQQQQVARYSGGVAQAMALATLETMRQTRSMLDQRRLALEYGLPQYVGFPSQYQPVQDSGPPGTETPSSQTREQLLEIESIDGRVTESNSSWWRYAWRLTVTNNSEATQSFDVVIEFQDTDGFIIDTDREYGLVSDPGAEQVFTGFALIDAAVASDVAQIVAKIEGRSS